MQDDRDEGHYRARIIRMKSGNGINSGKLKMPEGRECWREEVGEVIVQRSCIRTNCYEQVDTYATKPHCERKEKENEVVASYTEIRFEISTNRAAIHFEFLVHEENVR